MIRWLSNIGPGTLIAAAFIGPGTVTMCVTAGVTHGYDLLWAMVFSTFATIVLQEMSARIGVVTGRGISEIIRTEIHMPMLRVLATVLIISAIVLGNAAYEAGNISGARLGIEAIGFDGSLVRRLGALFVGIVAFVLLYVGNYKILERVLIGVVMVMALSFFVAALMTQPDWRALFYGLTVPSVPNDSTMTIMGIIGTTVVPYNLFLHASLVKDKWKGGNALPLVRKDLYISIGLGSLISLMIIIAAASLHGTGATVTNAADMASSLEPALGSASRYLIGIGLFAAGLTSAITAPLAAAYVCTELLGWDSSLQSRPFRSVWMGILLIGVIFSNLGWSPVMIIRYAQFTNGMLLPIVAGFLLWLVNKRSILKHHRNANWQNVLGFFILAVTMALGIKSIIAVIQSF